MNFRNIENKRFNLITLMIPKTASISSLQASDITSTMNLVRRYLCRRGLILAAICTRTIKKTSLPEKNKRKIKQNS